jgi:hypothetical protein
MTNQFEALGDRSAAGTTSLAQAVGQHMLEEIQSPPGGKQVAVTGDSSGGCVPSPLPWEHGNGDGGAKPVTRESPAPKGGGQVEATPITGDHGKDTGTGIGTRPINGDGTDKFVDGDSYKPKGGDGVVRPITGDSTGTDKVTAVGSDRGQGNWTPITDERPGQRQGQTPWLPDIRIADPTPPNTHPHEFQLLHNPGDVNSQTSASTTAPTHDSPRPLTAK